MSVRVRDMAVGTNKSIFVKKCKSFKSTLEFLLFRSKKPNVLLGDLALPTFFITGEHRHELGLLHKGYFSSSINKGVSAAFPHKPPYYRSVFVASPKISFHVALLEFIVINQCKSLLG